jgi:hypothetical protein
MRSNYDVKQLSKVEVLFRVKDLGGELSAEIFALKATFNLLSSQKPINSIQIQVKENF